jgi:hypothetical protein
VPIAYEDRLIEPDKLGTTIKLSFLQGPARSAPTDYSKQGRCRHPCIRPAAVTCPEIRWPPGSWFSGPAPPSLHPAQGRAGGTDCDHGQGLSALAGTPNAESARLSTGPAVRVTARRSAGSAALVVASRSRHSGEVLHASRQVDQVAGGLEQGSCAGQFRLRPRSACVSARRSTKRVARALSVSRAAARSCRACSPSASRPWVSNIPQ